MENEIIDLGSWNVPTSWDEITLKQFQEIEKYYSDKDKAFDAREVLHIFTNKSIDDINKLPISFTNELMNQLLFLQDKPNDYKPSNVIEIDGVRYGINVMEKLKTGEYVAVDTILKADPYNYAAILGVLCRKDGEIYDSRFEAEELNKRIEMFEKQSIMKIFPTIGFFLSLYGVQKIPSLLYSEVEDKLNLIQKHLETSENLGVFKKFSLNLQMKKLRKLLESNKNI